MSIVLAAITLPAIVHAAYGDTSTLSGKPLAGDGSQATQAWVDFADDVAFRSNGVYYIADTFNNAIRYVTTDGVMQTLAGNGEYGFKDASGSSARFALPRGVTISDNVVYVADTGNNAVRKVTTTGSVTTLVSAGLRSPEDVVGYGTRLYILDTGNHAIRYVAKSGGVVKTLTATGLNNPKKFDISSDGKTLYVADQGSSRILSVSTSTGAVSVVAGSGTYGYKEGTGTNAKFQHVWGVTVSGSTLYVSDHNLALVDRIRKINLSTKQTSLLRQDTAQQIMIFPAGLDVYNGRVYVAMSGLGTIHSFATSNGNDDQLEMGKERFQNRNGSNPLYGRPADLIPSPDKKFLYLAENNKIRKVRVSDGNTSHVIGSSVDNYVEGADASSPPMRFSTVAGITMNSSGSWLYVSDRWNNRIRRVNLSQSPPVASVLSGAGLINTNGTQNNGYQEGARCSTTVQTTGVSGCAYFQNPTGIVISPDDTFLYVADTGNNRIRKVRISNGSTSLVAGSGTAGYADGVGGAAKFNRPFGLALNAAGTVLYVADSANQRIRAINLATKQVTTLAGSGQHGYRDGIGTNAIFAYPEYVTLGPDGRLYVTEVGHRVRVIDPADGDTRLVAGSGVRGYANGNRKNARFNNLKGLAIIGTNAYVADSWNDVIRKINVNGEAPHADPAPRVDRVEPNQVNPNWDNGSGLRVAVKGANFKHGATTFFGNIEAEMTWVASDQVVAQLPLSQMLPGWYDVSVQNLDTQESTLPSGMGLQDPATGQVPNRRFAREGAAGNDVPTVAPGRGFFGYPSSWRGGFSIAAGNVLGGLKPEIIFAGGTGFGPQVRVFDDGGTVQRQFFAYAEGLRSGIRLSTCDLSGNAYEEIVTVPGPGAPPHVRIFTADGTPVGGFFALDGKFRGGAHLACGDVNGDGKSEIVVTAGKGGGAHVTVYTGNGTLIANFFAYDQHAFRGGIRVATVDIDDDAKDEIITGPEFGSPHVQMFKIRPNEIRRLNPGIYAFAESYKGGVDVAGADIDGDGAQEIVVSVGLDAEPLVKVYDKRFEVVHRSFYAFNVDFTHGVHVVGADMDQDGDEEIIAVPRANGGPNIRIIE